MLKIPQSFRVETGRLLSLLKSSKIKRVNYSRFTDVPTLLGDDLLVANFDQMRMPLKMNFEKVPVMLSRSREFIR